VPDAGGGEVIDLLKDGTIFRAMIIIAVLFSGIYQVVSGDRPSSEYLTLLTVIVMYFFKRGKEEK
jgi:hypothetical protein